eukprot:COSAG01_NODE_69_length_28801_cov_10.460038_16_plen_196_part_00
MLYKNLTTLFRRHVYVTYNETFKSESNNAFIERFVAKHPLLKPKFLVVNDQIEGFKKNSHRYDGLEKFPIYFEIEYVLNEDHEIYVNHFDLSTEANIQVKDRLSDVIFLSRRFSDSIALTRNLLVNEYSIESISIASKLPELIFDQGFDDDLDEDEQEMLSALIESKMKSFVDFVKMMDDLLVKGKSLDQITQLS